MTMSPVRWERVLTVLVLFWSGRNNFKLGQNDFDLGRNDFELGRNDSELGRNDCNSRNLG